MKLIRYSCLVVFVCVAVVVFLGTLDWLSKYVLYVQQRSVLHELIHDGQEYKATKQTVAYLQGSATRTLNNLKDTYLYLAPLLAAAFYIYRKER
jgi:hypothetical protein